MAAILVSLEEKQRLDKHLAQRYKQQKSYQMSRSLKAQGVKN